MNDEFIVELIFAQRVIQFYDLLKISKNILKCIFNIRKQFFTSKYFCGFCKVVTVIVTIF